MQCNSCNPSLADNNIGILFFSLCTVTVTNRDRQMLIFFFFRTQPQTISYDNTKFVLYEELVNISEIAKIICWSKYTEDHYLAQCDMIHPPPPPYQKVHSDPRLAWMVKLLSSGALLASLCRAAAVTNSQCLVAASKQQSCPALLVVRMVHSKCRGETYKYGKDEVKRTKCFRRYNYTTL